MIRIRHAKTGHEQVVADKQAVSNFIAAQSDGQHWEAPANLGEYPKADPEAVKSLKSLQQPAEAVTTHKAEDKQPKPEPKADVKEAEKAAAPKPAAKKAKAR